MKRLTAVASLITPTSVLADIGCDHGYLCLYVLKNNLADRVYAADISAGSLEKAKRLLKDYQNAECFLSDGFDSLPCDIETAVISGMGGRNMMDIISRRQIKTLILQPQKNLNQLEQFLVSRGYKITDKIFAEERRHNYTVIKAVLNEMNVTEEIKEND